MALTHQPFRDAGLESNRRAQTAGKAEPIKGRTPSGKPRRRAKNVTAKQAMEITIHSLRNDGKSTALAFGVSESVVYRIRRDAKDMHTTVARAADVFQQKLRRGEVVDWPKRKDPRPQKPKNAAKDTGSEKPRVKTGDHMADAVIKEVLQENKTLRRENAALRAELGKRLIEEALGGYRA